MTRLPATAVVVLAMLGVLHASPVSAQSCTTSSSIRSATLRSCGTAISVTAANATAYTNPKILALTASTTSITLTADEAAFVDGFTPEVSVTLQVRANRSWTISASGSAFWSATGALAWSAKPVGDLRWATTSGAAGTALSTTAKQIAAGTAGGNSTATLFWKSTLSWTTDKPGAYTMPVTLTLTTP